MRPARAALTVAWAYVAPMFVAAQVEARAEHPITWTTQSANVAVRAGDSARVVLHARIAEFFHLYSTTQPPGGPVRTTVQLVSNGPFALIGAVRAPDPTKIPDGNFGIMTEVYDDSVTLGLTVRAAPAAGAGPAVLLVGIRYQACTTRYCLPPRVDTVRVHLLVTRKVQ
jgi:hypothetical protein